MNTLPIKSLTRAARRPGAPVVICLLLTMLPVLLFPAPLAPAWWNDWQVLDPTLPKDDYSAVNVGQLKNIAAKAAAAMNASLPGGAGGEVNGLIEDWDEALQDQTTGDDYAGVNAGMLKFVASKFYLRMQQAHAADPAGHPAAYAFPWHGLSIPEGSTTAGSTTIAFPSTTGISPGMPVSGPGVSPGTRVMTVSTGGYHLVSPGSI